MEGVYTEWVSAVGVGETIMITRVKNTKANDI